MSKPGAAKRVPIEPQCAMAEVPVSSARTSCKQRLLSGLAVGAIVLLMFVVWFSLSPNDKVSRTPTDFLEDLRAPEPWVSTLAHRTRTVRFLPNQWRKRLDAQEFAISRKREDAARQLGWMGTNAWVFIPELMSTMREQNIGHGYMAAQALFGMKASEHPEWRRFSKPLKGSKEVAQLFHYMLIDIYSRRGTESEVAEYRRFALVGLAATGPAATPFYGEVMQNAQFSNEPRIRAAAVMALTGMELQRTNTVPFFKRTLSDPEEWPEVSACAAAALAEAAGNHRETRELLRKALSDRRSVVRLEAAGSLLRHDEPVETIMPVLRELLDHKLASVRIKALKIVAETGAAAAVIGPQVESALNDRDSGVQAAAQQALEGLRNK